MNTVLYENRRFRLCNSNEVLARGQTVYCFNRPPGSETLLDPLTIMSGEVQHSTFGRVAVKWSNDHWDNHNKDTILVELEQ